MLTKKELVSLAAITAKAKYSISSNQSSTNVAEALLRLFPQMEPEFRYQAELEAAGRIFEALTSYLVLLDGRPDGPEPIAAAQRMQLLEFKWDIADELSRWLAKEGVSAMAVVEASVNGCDLAKVQSLKVHMAEAAVADQELALFATLLPGGSQDLQSLLS